jgi:hypothetical protein
MAPRQLALASAHVLPATSSRGTFRAASVGLPISAGLDRLAHDQIRPGSQAPPSVGAGSPDRVNIGRQPSPSRLLHQAQSGRDVGARLPSRVAACGQKEAPRTVRGDDRIAAKSSLLCQAAVAIWAFLSGRWKRPGGRRTAWIGPLWGCYWSRAARREPQKG